MEAIEERIRQAAKEEARQEANKEVMTMVGSLLAAIQTGGGAMSVMNKADAAMETGTKRISTVFPHVRYILERAFLILRQSNRKR